MGSFRNIVKIENMRKLMEENDSLSALEILETIDLKKIKNLSDLSLIAEIYNQNAKYEEAYDLLLKVYEKSKTRKTLYQLISTSIDRNNAEDAERYLAQYGEVAPKDFSNYIFRYKIDKLKGEPYNKLINTLEKLKKEEYIEKWAYELAKLYYKAGMDRECVNECSDIILWFGEGKYVEKARMLRSYFMGEKDKEKMIEELKKRAGSFGTMTKENIDFNNSSYYDNTAVKEENTENEDPEPEEDVEGIAASLKNEVENILAGGNLETYIREEMPEEEYTEEETYEEETGEETAEEGMVEGDLTDETAWIEEREGIEKEESRGILGLRKISSELDLDMEDIFCEFLNNVAVIDQLLDKKDVIFNVDKKGLQLVVTGLEDSDKMSFSRGIAILLKKTGRLSTSRIAKIKADKLNNIHLSNKKEKLRGCCVIVENASELKKITIEQIQKLVKSLNGDISIIYEEDSRKADLLFIGVSERQNILRLHFRL